MLNLRQLNKLERSAANSNAEDFSRFSDPSFRVPSQSLGNIGEPLDYRQAERYIYGDDDNVGIELSDFDGYAYGIMRVAEGPPVARQPRGHRSSTNDEKDCREKIIEVFSL